MFETSMIQNLEQQSDLKAIQGDSSNPWRKLVTKEYKSFLDSMTMKQETKENCDE